MLNLGSETLVIVHADLVKDSFDNSQSRDWANATRTTYEYCMVQPFLPSPNRAPEDEVQRDFSLARWRAHLPENATAEYFDLVEWRSQTYEIRGAPQTYYDFEGNSHHLQMILQLRRG